MTWLRIWWRHLRGHRAADPWEDDPRIVAARADQHRRIDEATAVLARAGLAIRRERLFWERFGAPPRTTDDG